LKAENFDDDENEGVELDEDERKNGEERCEMEGDESEEGTGDGGGNDKEKSPDYVALVKQVCISSINKLIINASGYLYFK